MKLCVVTCTYGRPHLLPRVIRCFEEQDYNDRCMLIYDDGGQYKSQVGRGWVLVSKPAREVSLGAKRNRSIKIAQEWFSGIDAFLPCDDDDLFMPWHLSASAAALANAEWSRPSVILAGRVIADTWIFQANYTGHKNDQTRERMYHPSWAIRVETWRRMGGYPEELSGPEDKGLMLKMEAAGVPEGDQIELGFPPSYVYCWGNQNISGMLSAADPKGTMAWAKLCKTLPPAELERWEPPFDLHNPLVAPGPPRPRPF